MSPPDLHSAFISPDNAHMPAAYWFWHVLPSDRDVVAQVAEMDEAGVRSFQIQARLSYPLTEYLDTAYLHACRRAVEEAAKRGMTVGIYDEYNWQSGHAGGRTVSGREDLRERALFWSPGTVDASGKVIARISGITSSTESLGPAAMEWHYEGATVEFDDWQIAGVALLRGTGPATSLDDLTAAARLVERTPTGCTVEVDGLDGSANGSVTVFCSARCRTSRIPNYLLPETAERFIEVGCKPYFDAFGDYFGTTVQYLFYDQPHANAYGWREHFGNLCSSLPYSEKLRSLAADVSELPFSSVLLALLVDIGPVTSSLRASFYDAYSDMACEAYFGTLRRWVEEHGIALSGHEVLGHVGSWNPGAAFSDIDLRTSFSLDHFRVDTYRHITGVDAQDCVPQLSPKLGDSVARAHDRQGCIVEQYMAGPQSGPSAYIGYWGLTLEELRAQAIRLQLLGARQFLFHAFYQTDGNGDDFTRLRNPRFDFAPGINYEPWWSYHREFADEIGRLSVFVDGASPVCEVALFYPVRTAWAEGVQHAWAGHLAFWAEYLAERGFGYHLVDETCLKAAQVSSGRLSLGERSYPCLVLPSVTMLRDLESVRALVNFVTDGGRLVVTGDAPRHLQFGADAALADSWSAVSAAPGYHHLSGIPTAAHADRMLAALRDERPYVIDDSDGSVWQWVGRDGEAWRVVLFNDSGRCATVSFVLPFAEAAIERWLTSDGGHGTWELLDDGAGSKVIPLGPMELACLRVRALAAGEELSAIAWADARPRGSALVLDTGWTLDFPGTAPVPVHVDRGWEHQGFARVSGVGTYRIHFQSAARGESAFLVLPVVHCAAEVHCNGVTIGRRGWSPFEFEVPANVLADGDNELEVLVASSAANKYCVGTPFDTGPVASGLGAPPVLYLARPT